VLREIGVAAINGVALGGGLELALCADYRIAEATAKVGLPEVHLGILPGGGTQRVPRLAGAEFATQLIVSGSSVSVLKAYKTGLIDRISEGELLDDAIDYAKELLESAAPLRDCNELTVDTSNLSANLFADFRATIARKTRGFFFSRALHTMC
jgi:3-hydroxyacyl-CoA dehydrogenase